MLHQDPDALGSSLSIVWRASFASGVKFSVFRAIGPIHCARLGQIVGYHSMACGGITCSNVDLPPPGTGHIVCEKLREKCDGDHGGSMKKSAFSEEQIAFALKQAKISGILSNLVEWASLRTPILSS